MKTTIQQQCPCGQTFDTDHDSSWPTLTETHCAPCRATLAEQRKAEQKAWEAEQEAIRLEKEAAAREAEVDEITPERLRLTDTADKRFNADLWAKVQACQPTSEKPWIGLIGEPGECKSRIAFLKLRKIARAHGRGFACDFISGVEFGNLVMRQFDRTKATTNTRNGGEWRTKETTVGAMAARELQCLREVPFLIFDELGKARPTPATVSELFALVDYRHSHNLVTIWTSNSEPEAFCASWPDEFAGPAAGRILESSTIIRA
jgi:hypothetical protein